MIRSRTRSRSLFALMTLLFVSTLTLGTSLAGVMAVQARDINGNTYTSPQFGYSLTWDSTWVVQEETSDVVDRLRLTNGISYVSLTGGKSFGGNAQLAGTVMTASVTGDPSVSDVVVGESGGDASRYWVNLTMNLNLDDGTVIPLVEYIEVRTVVPGQSVVIFDAYGNSAYASLARPAQDALLNGLVIPEPTIQLEKGEQGPVFMAGPWRVAIVAAAQNNRLRGIGLEKKDGKEWVAVVADVTNWGSSNPAFPVEEFFMEMVESPTQHSVASGSTATAARELGLSTDSPVEIEYGKTGRVVMVFSVNADRSEPTLVYRLERLPLDDILLFDLEQSDLSAPAGPPDLQQARLDSISDDGQYIEVRYEGESKTHRLQLLGVDVSGTPDAAIALLTEFDGEFVWIETDPAIKSTGTPSVYLWFENDRGDLQMLNHLLLQEGAAQYDELPGDARFATWLASTAARVTTAE